MAYLNKQVKPVIPGNLQNTQFTSEDVLFDWTEFDIPRGGAALKTVTAIIRGKDGVDQPSLQHIHLLFARSINGSAPASLGTVNGSANGTGYFNNIIGGFVLDKSDALVSGLDFITIYQQGHSGAAAQGLPQISFSTEDASTAATKGTERYYVAALHVGGSGFNFSTGVLLNQGSDQATATGSTTLTVDGTDARKVFSVGDVMVDAAGATIGTVTAVAELSVTVDAVANAITDDDELLVQSPVGLQLSIELA
tara:strand:- start:53 stop:808 length:756 start_codon:yes stop_codon:yes gene_type:complete